MAASCKSSDALAMATSHWWQRCSTSITPQNPFKQDLDDVSQFFVRSEVKSNPFCSDSGFAEPTTPLATSASQPTVTVQSSNPFRGDETVSNDEKSSELSADQRIRKPVKLPEDFDGKQPLKEYLLHFERCSLINGWTEEEKAMFLAASLRGESRKLLSVLTESEGRQYTKIVERLQLRFGVEKQRELLYSWRFSHYSVPFHWLVHGHMTSNNETVSRQMP